MTVISLDSARRQSAGRVDPDTGLRLPITYRRVVSESASATILDISAAHDSPPSGATCLYQVALPYMGVFTYKVGRRSAVIDANSVLMAPAGIEYADVHPVRDMGHAVAIIAPAAEVMEELCRLVGARPSELFRDLSQPGGPSMTLAAHRLRMLADHADGPLEADELAIHILQDIFEAGGTPRGRPSQVVERTKQLIHERGCERLSLADIAGAVGVSPVYLTQEFSRTEGKPLYKYQLQLRLSRALVELPHCEDITGLAIDLGFSSHSHFGAAFRRVFGITPAEFRARGAAWLQPEAAEWLRRRRV